MHPFSCQHKRNNEITVVQEINISRLELPRWPFEVVISFLKYTFTVGFGIEFWLIPFGIM